jgi:membrane-bound ClpP family serine protease
MNTTIANTLTNIEKGFNIAGSIPVVSFFSGAIRAIAGKIQGVVGAIFFVMGLASYMVTNDSRWIPLINLGSELVIHGALNVLRGVGEAMLCVTTLVGNIMLLVPNMSKEDMFSPYFDYGSFTIEERVDCCCR